jgi:hypothetical protein
MEFYGISGIVIKDVGGGTVLKLILDRMGWYELDRSGSG